jgi:hypothetical protein
VKAKDDAMRDFRDAKAMAQTLRASLASKGFRMTVSQSLELIAELFGMPDWNTLAAAIRRGEPKQAADASAKPDASARWPSALTLDLETTLQRAVAYAEDRRHEFVTLEHLLLALVDDNDALAAMKAADIDLTMLKQDLESYIVLELRVLQSNDSRLPTPTHAFRRALYRAAVRTKTLQRPTNGSDVLTAMFDQTESPAVWLLKEQGLSRKKIAQFTSGH